MLVCARSVHHPMAAPRSTTYVVMASSSVAIVTWGILQWRARKRARLIAANAERMVQDGVMIDCDDPKVRAQIIKNSTNWAKKWMSFLNTDDAKPMRGQVGGLSFHKRPVLTLPPDYVMKPLHTDSRGFREIAFYEAIKHASRHAGGAGGKNASLVALSDAVRQFRNMATLKATEEAGSVAAGNCDALAMWLAMLTHDTVVAESENTLVSAWRTVLKEMELLRRLSTFTASYYGVIGQGPVGNPVVGSSTSVPVSEISTSSYLLLSDVTVNFSKPCAIDLKMGRRSYEPDAPHDKRHREINKYPQQDMFGFRIVGMRVYDPSHPEADHLGFRTFEKSFGRSLESRESVIDAFRTFFRRADTPDDNKSVRSGAGDLSPKRIQTGKDTGHERIRTRSISNLLTHLRCLQTWFEENKSLAFYSSSILMVYEGDTSEGSNRDVANLKMIDFGHVRRKSGGDEGYRHGLRTVTGMLNEILQETNEVNNRQF